MHRAAETNNVEMLSKLLAVGCLLELPNRYGETPVVVAALHEATESVLFLMGRKANMRAKSFDGLTPFQIAAKYGFPEMMKALFVEGGGTLLRLLPSSAALWARCVFALQCTPCRRRRWWLS